MSSLHPDKLTKSVERPPTIGFPIRQNVNTRTPEELLLQIFEPLAELRQDDNPFRRTNVPIGNASTNIKSLASISGVCIRWHAIVEPLLYSTYMRPHCVCKRDVEFSLGLNRMILPELAMPNQSLRTVLRTIIRRPQLAEHIKRIALNPCVTSVHRQYESQSMWMPPPSIVVGTPTPALLRQYSTIKQKLASSEYRLFDGDGDLEIVFLLNLSPNASHLYLAQVPLVEKWFSIARSNPQMPFARQIKYVSLSNPDISLTTCMTRLRLLMSLPSLRKIELHKCHVSNPDSVPPRRGLNPQHELQRPSTLTQIKFVDCHMSKRTFEVLMQNCSAIESFKWITYEESDMSGFDIRDIAKGVVGFIDRQMLLMRLSHLSEDTLYYFKAIGLSSSGFTQLRQSLVQVAITWM
ncbi:hypothetical protein AUEXF2481DRAFT_491141 [Aureobasidium subglaciale EXF-2481]|uniref:Uncharacterized protein n=1 Tax=Aureobasidium subglaciale (strain EXF-2481) TaxID=1043005 RepID=A0A074ZIZ1_AURSE|nr:uncharacterized protein AUEXF2481DRAFT_491141 [Aureobasidium subglaciale EXF-2481]KEQ98501.1 hypothetical protein AUEXF2481DRAFT_491141 [Aureobasidium subglaciale EXF-2481]